jgi:protein TonB
MLNQRQSFLVSLAMHVGLVLVLLIAGALVARRIMGPRPIQLDLVAPVEVGPEEEAGAPKEPEPEPEIVEREVDEKPTYDPSKSLDLSKIPEIEREEFEPYKPSVTAVDSGAPSSPEARYLALVVAGCKRNWEKTKPSRGVLGSTAPTLRAVITIRRDGRYVSHRITRSSGIAAVDRSVDEAIRLSDPFPAFPREMAGAQQDFEIEFILEH